MSRGQSGATFKHCSGKYGVTPHVRFGTRITSASADGMKRHAQIVINCLGVLVHPMDPDIEGLESFEGARFHSARWDHAVAMEGRRIGVIGTGSPATRIICALADKASRLEMVQRTAQWVCGCSSWYLDKNGLPRMHPFTPNDYRHEMKDPDISEFDVTATA